MAAAFTRFTTEVLPLPFAVDLTAGRDGVFIFDLDFAAGAFTLDWFEGGHFFIKQREGDVLAVLAQRLAGSQSLQGGIHAARVRA